MSSRAERAWRRASPESRRKRWLSRPRGRHASCSRSPSVCRARWRRPGSRSSSTTRRTGSTRTSATASARRARTPARCAPRSRRRTRAPAPTSILVAARHLRDQIAPINENAANVGDFEILDPVTIEKHPATSATSSSTAATRCPSAPLIARGLDRLFEIHPGAGDVTFRDVILQNGFSPEEGGAIQNWSLGKLTLDGVTIRDSYAEKAGGGLNHADLHDYPWTTEPPNLDLLPHGRVEIKARPSRATASGGGGAAINNVSGGTITISDESVITLNPGPIKPDPLDPEEFVLVDPSDYPIDASAISNEAELGQRSGTIRISTTRPSR